MLWWLSILFLKAAIWCFEHSQLTVVMAANWCCDGCQSLLLKKPFDWCCDGSQLTVEMAANRCCDGCQSLLLKKPFDWCCDGCLFLMPYIILKSFRVIFSGTDKKFRKNVLNETYLYIFMHWLLEMMGRLTSRSTGEIWPNSDSRPQPAIHKVSKVRIWNVI